MIVYGITQADQISPLGLVKVAHKGIGGGAVEDGNQVFNGGPEQVSAGQLWEGSFGKPSELVHNPCVASAFGTDDVASVVVQSRAHIPGFDGVLCPSFAKTGFGMSMDFDPRRCDWVVVEIEPAMDAFPR